MQTFLSCDWGTTNFRLRLIDAATYTVLSEVATSEGIQATYNNWNLQEMPSVTRVAFYQSIIANALKKLQAQYDAPVTNIPIVVSGMASSSIGMVELPYKPIPLSLKNMNLEHVVIDASENFKHRMLLISGIKSEDDVIRGEETKIAGCYKSNEEGKHLFIIPGTHTKHVETDVKSIIAFSTFMTGEIFNILSTGSILKASVRTASFNQQYDKAFANGVISGSTTNILHSLFTTRTNQLFSKYNKEENYFYLSGLLIGNELKDIVHQAFDSIHLICNKTMEPYYLAALQLLLPSKTIQIIDSDVALIQGQLKIATALNFI